MNSNLGQTKNSELYSFAWQSLNGKWGICIGFIIVFQIISFFVALTLGQILLSWLVMAPLTVGNALFFINVSRDENPQIDNMFKGFDSFGASIGAYWLTVLIIIAGYLLLIIPGIIWAYQYSMVYYIIADDPKCGGNEALVRSREMMYGHKWKMFRFSLRAMGIVILCILTLGIGFLWGIPWIATAHAKFYDDIKPDSLESFVEPDEITTNQEIGSTHVRQ
tara:strand:+ start:839 stop:1501 length:663 start_codon:yes stop_codon:yes gene_type:complete